MKFKFLFLILSFLVLTIKALASENELPKETIQNPLLLQAQEKVEVIERELNSADKINLNIEQPLQIIKEKASTLPEIVTNLQNLNLNNVTIDGKEIIQGTGLKTESVFGIFQIQVPVSVTINPLTGEVITSNKSIWEIFLSYIGF